jgi:hypothetical protein
MHLQLQRPEWTPALDSWARAQSRQLDWEHRIEMRRRIFVRAATNGDKRLREALFALIATAHSIGQEMQKRQADADGLSDRDIEVLATGVIAVIGLVPSPNGRGSDEEIPF